MSKTTLYVASLEHWFDCYKRAEGYSTSVGIFTSKLAAYRAALKLEILDNAEHCEFEDIKGSPYMEQFRKLEEIQENELEALIPKMEEYREEYLGKPEFTMKPSGARLTVNEFIVDQVSGNRKYLRKLERTLWEELDPESAKDLKNEDDEEDDEEE